MSWHFTCNADVNGHLPTLSEKILALSSKIRTSPKTTGTRGIVNKSLEWKERPFAKKTGRNQSMLPTLPVALS